MGPGVCQARQAAHWAPPQGRILLGPEGVPLRRVDVLAANGVIHMLEGVLLPPTILPILPKHCNEEQYKIVAVSTCRTVPAFLGSLFSSSGFRAGAWAHTPQRCLPPPPPGLSSAVDGSFKITPASSGPLSQPSATVLTLPR